MMNIPCFYFPSTVMLIDDNKTLLENLSLNFDQYLRYKLYDNPMQALDAINDQLSHSSLNDNFLMHNKVESDDCDISVQVNFDAIRSLLRVSNRSSYITAIVIDHCMPEMTGVEFCQHLRGIPMKKIMLTGAATPALAVDAFNAGIIDQFIAKSSDDMIVQLKESIVSAQWNYFLQQSKDLMTVLKGYSECALHEPIYQVLIKEFFTRNYPCEFYLLDQTGSFLFINSHGAITWMVIKSHKELNSYYDVANDYAKAHMVSDNLLYDLKHHIKIPFLLTKHQQMLRIR